MEKETRWGLCVEFSLDFASDCPYYISEPYISSEVLANCIDLPISFGSRIQKWLCQESQVFSSFSGYVRVEESLHPLVL